MSGLRGHRRMRPNRLNEAITASSCPSNAMALARGKNASMELLARLNARRKGYGLPELLRYPSDNEFLKYFSERMKNDRLNSNLDSSDRDTCRMVDRIV